MTSKALLATISGFAAAAITMATLAGPAQAEPLGFDAALDAILARDPEIQIANATRESIVGQNRYTRFHLLPSISLEASQGRYDPGGDVTDLSARARFSLFRFGADLAALEAARAQETALQFQVDRTTLDRESTAVRALIDFVQLSQKNQILAELEKLQLGSVAVAEREYRAGRIALQELQAVQIDLENVRARIGESSISYQTARGVLIQLLGHADVQTGWPWKDRIQARKISPEWKAQDYYAHRPDFEAADYSFLAQDRLRSQAFRSMFPSLNATLSYGLTKDTALTNRFERAWSGVLSLSIPLFNRFADYSNYLYQSSLRDVAENRRIEVVRQIDSEFEAVPKRFVDAQTTAIARDKVLEVSHRLYEQNLARFKMGRASSNELNIDLNRYLDTELNDISGWALAHTAYTDLAHLLGKRVSAF